ncbi:ferric-dicitrate binding protein FerR (iron transport regulator) [Dysgonomonas hofstadii]|uniref:Ferric-dicitrate binding protein FerR (Iron transport regulator) n=1 Tax=Dysgonomonas hofstadii TaxID=637886 RepID=A0A840CLD5_9BACT|nr:FecR family protein [Dysgonomonas hofstadii]MBB4036800.1 ferric-dicitrate binding protein FerR (iron transport regulator) [Dysgonomonas hofstadii]
MNNKINEEYWLGLIVDYLSGTISEEDKLLLDNWMDVSQENKDFFEQVKMIYYSVEVVKNKSEFDKDKAYNIFLHRIRTEENRAVNDNETDIHYNQEKQYTRKTLIWIAGIAASLALLIGLSFSFISMPGKLAAPGKVLVESPPGQKTKVYLPDGTLVWLNSGSNLTYYTDFNVKNRNVQLQGEAFFDVSKNPQLAFDILADGVKVEVLGTSFNVNAYGTEDYVAVSLLEGKVAVMDANNNELLSGLSPQQKLVIDKQTKKYELLSCDADMDGIWRYGQLKINNDPMSQVIAKMERWYGVNIQLEGEQRSERYWLTIKTESLTEILELINKITPIRYQIKGEEVTIRYK